MYKESYKRSGRQPDELSSKDKAKRFRPQTANASGADRMRNADIASQRSRQSQGERPGERYGNARPTMNDAVYEAYMSKTPSATPKMPQQARPQSGYAGNSKTPQHVSRKAANIREMNTHKFLQTDINDYLDKNKKENCVNFKEFLADKKKVLQFKYAKNMHSDYSEHFPKYKVQKQQIWNLDNEKR
jgi:hypothetical protein